MTISKKVTAKACLLTSPQVGGCPFTFSKMGGEEGSENNLATQVKIEGYSGGIIEKHWYWGNLAIDTAGMQFPKESYPILFAHDTENRIGFSSTPAVNAKGGLDITGTLLDNDTAKDFAKDSAAGFNFEASIKVDPRKVQILADNEEATVNGFIMSGPGTIFRESVYKEVSVCIFGWDSNTSATAFANDGEIVYNVTEEKNMPFDTVAFKKDDPDGYAAFVKTITDEAVSAVTAELAKSADELTKLKTELSKTVEDKTKAETEKKCATTELSQTIDRLTKLEKEVALRQEQVLHSSFANMLTTALTKSELPERLHAKFAKTFSVEGYLTPTGEIDIAKFNKDVAAELADWGAAVGSPVVLGGGAGFAKTESGSNTASMAMDDDAYASMAQQMGLDVAAKKKNC